jgi:uncharacterized protein (DUF697 family)
MPNEPTPKMDAEADDLIHWATARAGVIVLVPGLGTVALTANEFYLVIRLGKVYGYDVSATAARGLLFGLGGAVLGSMALTILPLPFLQIPVGMGVTYAVGMAAKEWFKAGMPSDLTAAREAFTKARKEAVGKLDRLKVHRQKDKPLGDESRKFVD